jgi:DNA primase
MNRVYKGKELAKVLIYYGLVGDVTTSDFNIVCPFHEDINPSMRIRLDDGTFYCFGCESNGNALDFVQRVNPELNDLQSCILLEKILSSNEVKNLNIKYKKKRKKQSRQALIEANDYYYGLRVTDWNYPTNEEEIKVLEYMKRRGFTERALNVGKCKVSYNPAYPILFPILDNGRFMGWVGRTTNKYVEDHRMKYLYNDGFRKRDTLCGNYSENCVPIICEGFMDYLSIRIRGHTKNVIALLGWHVSDEQIKKLKKKNISTVISALDNDNCGNKGTKLLEKYFDVIRFEFPEGVKDAGDMTEYQIVKSIRKARIKANEIKIRN